MAKVTVDAPGLKLDSYSCSNCRTIASCQYWSILVSSVSYGVGVRQLIDYYFMLEM